MELITMLQNKCKIFIIWKAMALLTYMQTIYMDFKFQNFILYSTQHQGSYYLNLTLIYPSMQN